MPHADGAAFRATGPSRAGGPAPVAGLARVAVPAAAAVDDGPARESVPERPALRVAGRERPLVLVVLKGLPMGGAEKVVLAQAGAWDHDRFEYHLTYLTPRLDLLVPEFEAIGIRVHRPEGKSLRANVFGGGFVRLLRRLRPDVVHAHLPVPGILARLLARPGAAVVYSEHSMPSSHRSVTHALNRATYGWNDLVVCVSTAIRDAVEDFPHKRVITVPNAVAVPQAVASPEAVREGLGVAPGQRLIVHVGNIRRVKGQSNLVHATAALARRRRDFQVVSAGVEEIPGELERLRQLAVDTGASDHLSFLGLRYDVADLMASADVVVNPSDSEGLPLAVLEAMLLGKPVVATAVGGVPALMPDGVCGLLVPPKDPEALADAMDRMLSDAELAQRLGNEAHALAASQYSLDATVRTLEDAYQELIVARAAR